MVFGRTKRRETDALRAEFVANRETVRSWTARWECPEVEWPPFDEVPGPTSLTDTALGGAPLNSHGSA